MWAVNREDCEMQTDGGNLERRQRKLARLAIDWNGWTGDNDDWLPIPSPSILRLILDVQTPIELQPRKDQWRSCPCHVGRSVNHNETGVVFGDD